MADMIRIMLFYFFMFSTIFSCKLRSKPTEDSPQFFGDKRSYEIPKGEWLEICYKKRDPNVIYIGKDSQRGPGFLLNLNTGKYEEVKARRKDQEMSPTRNRDESTEDWIRRVEHRVPTFVIPPDQFDRFECMGSQAISKNSNYNVQYIGSKKWKTVNSSNGVLQQGTIYFLFSGDLVINVLGKEVVRQHFVNVPSWELERRAWLASDHGILLYMANREKNPTTLYVIHMERAKMESK